MNNLAMTTDDGCKGRQLVESTVVLRPYVPNEMGLSGITPICVTHLL